MEREFSFDIAFLGLSDPTQAGRSRMVLAMERLTGKPNDECKAVLTKTGQTIFYALPADQAGLIADALDDAGAIFEIRPREEAAQAGEGGLSGGMSPCPSCGFVQSDALDECGRCGVIFSKMERDEVRSMQKDQALEEAEFRAEQIRQEWDDRANQYLENHPLAEEKIQVFNSVIAQEEICFVALDAAEGPILMTSRQFVGLIDSDFVFMPYEMIKDVDFGGGLVVKKGRTRLVLSFHAPIPFRDKNVNSLTWYLDDKSASHKETIMDWAFARSYMCGQCGARDLDHRNEDGANRARCMHCATDHDIDLRSHTITPLVSS